MFKIILLSILGLGVIVLSLLNLNPAYAAEPYPGFGGVSLFRTYCSNPIQGQKVASYPEGWHQIAGGPLLFGSDYVYKISDKFFIQCFCPKVGSSGIQSIWMNESWVPGANQQQALLKAGWMKIPNGPQWGLPQGSYFVINNTHNCKTCTPVSQGNGSPDQGETVRFNRDSVPPAYISDNTSPIKPPANVRFCSTTTVNGQTQRTCSSR